MVEVMELLSIFIHEKEFYSVIVNDLRSIGVDISLTLLRTFKDEYEQMIKDPEQFV